MLLLALLLAAAAGPVQSKLDLTLLFSHIWQITKAPSKPAPGSLYIFLPNGTMLQTSCVETYRIARWTIDQKSPSMLRVVEDRQLAFRAEITALTGTTLHLRQHLAHGGETRDLTLQAVEQEFVCPALPK